MAKRRILDTKFWTDSYIAELNPKEKLLFLYLLTNPLTNIAGIYEITYRQISFDTGISKDDLSAMFKKFEKDRKIYYIFDTHIAIANFIKYQELNKKIIEGIKKVIFELPKHIKTIIKDRLYIDYDSLCIDYDIFNTNYNTNNNSNTFDLDYLWNLYPKKLGKKQAIKHLSSSIKTEKDFEDCKNAIENYKYELKKNNTEEKYIKHGSTFFNNWQDYIPKEKIYRREEPC